MGIIEQDLCAAGLELIETHISWVFLGERDVWTVKKPVSLGFLDFSTRELRRAACEPEVELNRRLAPHVYRAVVPVTRDAAGRDHLGGAGQPVDWAVQMVRLPDRHRADVRLGDGRLTALLLDLLALRIAAFHAAARCDAVTGRFGAVEMIGRNVRENFEQTREATSTYLTPAESREIERWQIEFLEGHASLFVERIAAGRVGDGHGDLRLEQVYCADDGTISILDCIEFNERFRYADVCADVAFLSMDLTWRGRPDLAEYFLACYARAADDYDLYRVVDFYESYRAYVRGKVATMLAADVNADARSRERARAEARRFFMLALASERRSLLPPVVVAVGGILAAGKSTVADRLSLDMAAPVIDSDRTRKSLLGAPATRHVAEAPWQGAYAPQVTSRVYEEVFRRAPPSSSSSAAPPRTCASIA